MNWYVKYEGTEEISGPFTQEEEALNRAERADGMVFSEEIFAPKFVTTSEVEDLLRDLRDVVNRVQDHVSGRVIGVAQRAIDTITLLSRDNSDTFDVGFLLTELRGLREAKEIIRQGEDDAIGVVLKQVMDALIFFSREKRE